MLFSLSVTNETVIVNTASQRSNEQRQVISHAFKSVYGKVRRLFRNFGSCRLFVGIRVYNNPQSNSLVTTWQGPLRHDLFRT